MSRSQFLSIFFMLLVIWVVLLAIYINTARAEWITTDKLVINESQFDTVGYYNVTDTVKSYFCLTYSLGDSAPAGELDFMTVCLQVSPKTDKVLVGLYRTWYPPDFIGPIPDYGYRNEWWMHYQGPEMGERDEQNL